MAVGDRIDGPRWTARDVITAQRPVSTDEKHCEDKCEVNTKGNEVVAPCLTPVGVWRDCVCPCLPLCSLLPPCCSLVLLLWPPLLAPCCPLVAALVGPVLPPCGRHCWPRVASCCPRVALCCTVLSLLPPCCPLVAARPCSPCLALLGLVFFCGLCLGLFSAWLFSD